MWRITHATHTHADQVTSKSSRPHVPRALLQKHYIKLMKQSRTAAMKKMTRQMFMRMSQLAFESALEVCRFFLGVFFLLHTYVYAYIYIYIYIGVYIYIYVYMHIYICIVTYFIRPLYMYICIYIYICVCVCVCVCVHSYILYSSVTGCWVKTWTWYVYIYTYIHVCTYIHTRQMPAANCKNNLNRENFLFELLRNTLNKHQVTKNISCSTVALAQMILGERISYKESYL